MAQAAAYPESEHGRETERERPRAERGATVQIQIRAAASRPSCCVAITARAGDPRSQYLPESCSSALRCPTLPSFHTLCQSVPLSFLLHDEFLLGCLGAANINRGFLITFALFFRFCLCFAFAEGTSGSPLSCLDLSDNAASVAVAAKADAAAVAAASLSAHGDCV